MGQNRCPWGVLFLATLGWAASSLSFAAEPPVESWLRGSGRDLEMRLHGEVVDADGAPVEGVVISGRIKPFGGGRVIEPAVTVTGNRFEAWLPVNRTQWQALWIKASAGDRVAYQRLTSSQLREAAIDGLKLTVQAPSRHVAVKVLAEGKPVASATVKAELNYGNELLATTDDAGVAQVPLLAEQTLTSLMAWKGQELIGGYSLSRTPPRDPAADEFTVELSATRPQRIRFVDEQGAPVAGVPFVLQVATPRPFYNFIGTNEEFALKTDGAGEAVCRHFPDWEEAYFYPELASDKWYVDQESGETVDGVLVFPLHPRRPRESVKGQVVANGTTAGGFQVWLDSFQGERKNEGDMLWTFSAADGSYEMHVLPEATYCAFVLDEQWVSKIVDLIPFQAAINHAAAPELTVLPGQKVEVVATTGPGNEPIPNLSMNFHRYHSFSWREGGEKRGGRGGPRWWATTDAAGRATTITLPGELAVSVYTPQWRVEEKIKVVAGEPAEVHFHRDVAEERSVAGSVTLADGTPVNAEQLELQVGSVDGKFNDQQVVTVAAAGDFKFKTRSEEIALFGRTRDGAWAGALVASELDSPLRLTLQPTVTFAGQLLDRKDQPLVNHRVVAYVRVKGNGRERASFAKWLEPMSAEAKTDAEGRYTLERLPCGPTIMLTADPLAGSEFTEYPGDFVLVPGEAREPMVSRLGSAKSNLYPGPLAERYRTLLRDCALSGFHLMVLDGNGTDAVQEVIDRRFIDDDENDAVARYMQFVLPRGSKELTAEDEAFMTAQGWRKPAEGRVAAYAIDGEGNKLGKLEIDVAATGQGAEATEFIRRHAPPQRDAAKAWEKALDEAKQTDRRVWARASGRYCSPCFRMSRWLDDQRELLEKDYVLFKIDNAADLHGVEIAERITDGKSMGIPFHAMFAADGTRIIDSDSTAGNIGHPASIEGKKHLRKMLLETRQRLTDAEIDQIVASLDD